MIYSDIEKYFSENVPQKNYSELSIDKESKSSLISSSKKSYDFDELNTKIKTSDTIIFNTKKISLVEFKNGDKIKEIDIRLKCSESIMSFLNFILEEQVVETLCFPSQFFQFYLVFNRKKINASQVNHFGNIQRKLQKEYSNFYSKVVIINQDQFKRVFRI
ncbi:hypothetical protein [Tenacibaculum sp.]|uniref:hypothetical protein n=1 Tax=Tenacibaculum sp. TaxID=1906242 RepID=UPI003AA905D7